MPGRHRSLHQGLQRDRRGTGGSAERTGDTGSARHHASRHHARRIDRGTAGQQVAFDDDPSSDDRLATESREVETFNTREYDPWEITEAQKKELREEILPYWKNKTVRERWFKQAKEALPNEWWILTDTTVADLRNFLHAPGSHISPPDEFIIHNGFKAYEKRVQEKLAALPAEEFEKGQFYRAVLAAIDGIRQWSKNYQAKALELAAKETDPVRAAELKEIAEITGRVPYEPARNFREALQSIYFAQCFLWMEGCGVGFNLGRADRYLLPFYEADLANGTLTREQAMELVECLWLKLTAIHGIRSHRHSRFAPGYFPYQQVHVGGIGKDLKYYTNELTYMFIDALLSVRTTQPTLCVLWHKDMPWALKAKAAKLVAGGMGHPSIFNYELLVNMRMNAEPGERWEDLIWDAKPIGCVETQGAGCRQFGHTDAAQLNGGSMVEMVLTRGVKRVGLHAGEKTGIDTGDPTKFQDLRGIQRSCQETGGIPDRRDRAWVMDGGEDHCPI